MEVETRKSYRWVILALLFAATTINYFDRIVLSVLIPEIKKDLGIDNIAYGYIVSAFQLTYTFGAIAAGWVIDRLGTKLGYTLSIFFWSVAAAMHCFCRTAFGLGFWRGMLGLTESGNFPVAIKSVSEWFEPRERSFATSLFNSGTSIASVIGPPVIVAITLSVGWRWTFFAFGALGFVLAIVWQFAYKSPVSVQAPDYGPCLKHAGAGIRGQAVSVSKSKWSDVLKYRQTYGIMLGKFLTDPVWWFYLFWMPNYLSEKRGFDLKAIGMAIPVVYISAALMGYVGGWLPGYFMKQGWSVGRARKTTMLLCALAMPITAFAVKVNNPWLAIMLMSLACGAHNGWMANIFTLSSDCFPPSAVGSVTGLASFGGGLGGFLVATFATGYIITWFGYVPIFVLMGILHPLAFLMICVLIKDVKIVGDGVV